MEAEGKLVAANREAEGRERLAQAEATATDVVSKAVAYVTAFRRLTISSPRSMSKHSRSVGGSANSRLVFMPMEASALVGSIGGVPVLVKGRLG